MIEKGIDKRKWDPAVPPATILDTVAETMGVEVKDLKGKSRRADFVEARDIAHYLLREELRASLNTIGSLTGGRDHSTITASLNRIKLRLRIDPTLMEIVSSIRQAVQPESKLTLK